MVHLKVIRQVRVAVRKDSPLVVRLPTKKRPLKLGEVRVAEWGRFGADAHTIVTNAHKSQQTVLWGILEAVARPRVTAVRVYRPTDAVSCPFVFGNELANED